MVETHHNMEHLSSLPTEVLLIILSYLPAKQLLKCRQICTRWKCIIDGLTRSNVLWRQYCRKDFEKIYSNAWQKARPGILWYNIYKSLALWPMLLDARETRDEFAAASSISQEIKDFKILNDGIIGVQTRSEIVYYDIETLDKAKRGSITGEYLSFAENNTFLVVLSNYLQLCIVRKIVYSPNLKTNTTFDNVKTFLLVDNIVYYINLNDEIFICNLESERLVSNFIKKSEDGIMSLGYTNNRLYILTFPRNIYTILNNKLVYVSTLGPDSNLLHELRQYNFLERLDWRVYFQWMYVLNHTIPEGPLRDIIVVRSYGDMVFVGSNWGVLRIYYSPHSEVFDIFNSEPLKQYNFMERYDCPVLSMCPILQIDVIESDDGHTVFVAMPKKIAILDYVHNFKRTSSVAMLPYSNVQKIKVLKICDQ